MWKIIKIIIKTSNVRPSYLLQRNENKNNNKTKPLDKNKSSKSLKYINDNNDTINNNTIDINNENIKNTKALNIQQKIEDINLTIPGKNENSDYFNKNDKKDKENINLLNLSSKTSSNRHNIKNKDKLQNFRIVIISKIKINYKI